ncbi:putative kinase [Paenibacillus shirakamiensis]|uniref:Kinase n=1 Tax=Paenibacillus shirakamiensis TaxID=1265935 RepID=A0ABS4JGH6_9BACL|nr:metallophosphoesterase [Paenibacillus shirakamiensis]MBP2000823.1 putative kinase [Paenibacillus shirakamiensis]
MEIITKVHTIFMLIGSTECGKTTFAKEVLMPQLAFRDADTSMRSNVQYLSSDQIRQDLLGFEYDKYDQVMLEASEQAFHILFERLKMATRFPVHAEFIVVDTTGLSDEFRSQVRNVAHMHNYNVEVILFDYRNREDYYASDRSKKLITSHLQRLKKDVLGSLSREGYTKIHRIRAKDFYDVPEGKRNANYKVVIENLDEYLSTILPHNSKYIIVGDVHECIDDLQGLLRSYGFIIEDHKLEATDRVRDTKIILAGDWIDKGQHTKEIIEFIYENQQHFLLVIGNHENFVYKYMKGEVSGVDAELLDHYFNSTQVLANDDALLEKFNHLYLNSKPFYKYQGSSSSSYYVTHAPCQNKYIGKLDSHSARHQRNFRINHEESVEGQLGFLKEEAVKNHPYHIFGHIAAKHAFRIHNKIHIDTGSVLGNSLSSVMITYKPIVRSYKSVEGRMNEKLPALFHEQRKVTLQELGDEELRRLHYVSKNQVNFISGTMSPADKDEDTHELESLKQGLNYFAQRGVNQVVLQPKYMGSRANLYLHKDRDQCFAVSRNGYKITHIDLHEIYTKLLHRFGEYMEQNKVSMLILDGELLPWKALGEGLIEKQFKPIEKALESEFQFLQQQGFDQALGKLMADYEASDFERDQFHTNKSALHEKYGSYVYQNYKHLHDIIQKYVPLEEHVAAYETYKKQLDIYAEDGELEYKPFNILKMIYEHGEERIPNEPTSELCHILMEDEWMKLDLTEEESYAQAAEYFSKLTVDQHMEGVVIKPEVVNLKTVPYMKVRNPEYLSIIYGYDYRLPHKYTKLLKQKNIQSKLRTSLNEYRLGQQMLAVKWEDISPEHTAYKEVVANLLFEVSREKEIDPRL